MPPSDLIGHGYDDLSIGQSASLEPICKDNDLVVFAHASGNLNLRHLLGLAEKVTGEKPVAPAMWGGSLFSALLGNVLPGPGTAYLQQSLNFHDRVYPGDVLTATVTVRDKRADPRVDLECRLTRSDGTLIADGMAEVTSPATGIRADDVTLSELWLQKRGKFERLLALCDGVPPMPTAVVAPTDHNALGGAWEAMKAGLIDPILIGPEGQIRAAAEEIGWDLTDIRIVATPDDHIAAARAVALNHEGRAAAVMKGRGIA